MPEGAGTATAGSGPPADRRFAGASERLRNTAKWMVVAAGAIAAVVAAGLNFSNLGALTWANPGRLTVAVAGVVAAIGGTIAALILTVLLAASSTVGAVQLRSTGPRDLEEVRERIEDDALLTYWRTRKPAGSSAYDQFRSTLEQAHDTYANDLILWRNSRQLAPSTAPLERSVAMLQHLNSIATQLLDTASYLKLFRTFQSTVKRLAIVLPIAGLGLIAVVWAANPPSAEKEAELEPRVVAASFTVPGADRDAVLSQLGGASCQASLDAVPVLLIDRPDDEQRITVVTTAAGCTPLRLRVDAADLTAP